MKVAYIAETSLTNKSAYTQHVIKMCDAFCQNDVDLTLLLPKVEENLSFKKIKKNFLLNSQKPFLIKSILNYKTKNFFLRVLFGLKVSKYVKKEKVDLIITRSLIASVFLSLMKINHFVEIHSELKSLTKFLMLDLNFINSKYISKIILISKSLNKIYKINKKKSLILHDGVDIKNFKNIKKIKKIETATYVGSFYKGRGIDLIVELAKQFKKINFKLYGQSNNNIKYKSKNIKIFKHVNYNKVPKILSNSDLLLMPYADVVFVRAKNINTANYCSPLKMFDYLASGKIILSSKLDGICEVLKHNNNSLIIDKYDPKKWIEVIKNVLKNKYNLNKLRKNSISTANKYTWNKRVIKILNATKRKVYGRK